MKNRETKENKIIITQISLLKMENKKKLKIHITKLQKYDRSNR